MNSVCGADAFASQVEAGDPYVAAADNQQSVIVLRQGDPHGEDRGQYPAENVVGWLVSERWLNPRQGGETYLGFLVKHAGIVQWGIAKPLSEWETTPPQWLARRVLLRWLEASPKAAASLPHAVPHAWIGGTASGIRGNRNGLEAPRRSLARESILRPVEPACIRNIELAYGDLLVLPLC